MKKITLLLALLITSIGFSQELLTNGDFQTGVAAPWTGNAANPIDLGGGNFVNQAEVKGVANPWDVNLSQPLALEAGKTYKLSYDAYTDAATGSRTMVAGIGESADNYDALTDNPALTATSQTFTYQYTVNYNDVANSRVLFDMGAEKGFVFIDNVSLTEVVADATADATLNDLKVDGTTITGFMATTLDYTFNVPSGTTVIPQITSATATNANVTSVTINQATAIPGDATVVVVSENGNVTKTYKVSYAAVGPPIAPTTPPARNAWDVVSLYSEAYTPVEFENFDAGWCGSNSVTEITIDNNKLLQYNGNNCQGIVLKNAVDVSDFTHMHVDVYIKSTVDVTSKVFNLKFVGVPNSIFIEYPFNAGTNPALVAGSWISIDIPVNLSTMTSFKEFGITADNLKNEVWYDNLYVYRAATASVENNKILGFKMYPNPAKNQLTISAKEAISRADVFNVLGRKVKSFTINSANKTLDISGLSSGIYLVKYKSAGKVGTAKFIKQ